jgi:hypothetical protein
MIDLILLLFAGDGGVSVTWGEKLLPSIISELPSWHTASLAKTYVMYSGKSRGIATANTVRINVEDIDTQKEFVAISVHEIGHSVDIGTLVGSPATKSSAFKDGTKQIYNGDPSLLFYKISWDNEKKTKKESRRKDFVSGYAMSSPFEDFAETYSAYRTSGSYFRCLGAESSVLRRKYWYMYNLFDGKQFQTEKEGFEMVTDCPTVYDVSLIE